MLQKDSIDVQGRRSCYDHLYEALIEYINSLFSTVQVNPTDNSKLISTEIILQQKQN